MIGTHALSAIAASIPVDPDAPEAHRLLLEELAKPEYRAAEPNWFDRASQAFFDWLGSLFAGADGAGSGWLPLVAVILVVAAVVVALLVWGVPRLNRRSAPSELFGQRETRSAEQMRAAARAAAAGQDWPLAIAEQFRALAADLAERTIVTLSPGTTATDFAAAAGRALPEEGRALADAARAFDEVRYLGHPGSEADYRAVQALDERVRASRPALPEPAVLA
ncbi:DUF4129 domain-containing protein [Microterricola pindariensis]|uniref:Protein-glutamine gamma-glutamyltransferase-like C-terminal domain-containing protein n=1 Tax=Microterricola pindariensis TaxID=478010 RepID=A0ABX5AZ27_9MICO|nr:DUF4129 domain-containing protein [Microterricola pindariensis]PPL20173.1 hypothetical protein GY24_02325 [Microterricola pindariensis]